MDVVAQVAGFELGFEFGDDLRRGMCAIAEFEDFCRALIEFHHAFGIENHVFLLCFFPLQAVHGRKL